MKISQGLFFFSKLINKIIIFRGEKGGKGLVKEDSDKGRKGEWIIMEFMQTVGIKITEFGRLK